MATKYFLGVVEAVQQVETGSIDSVDATPSNNTFTVTIGGIAISVAGDTDVNTTATNLRAALNASEHPAFDRITWGGTSGNIVGTSDVAGLEFTAALTETGAGTGTVTDFTTTTANASPHDWNDGGNWSDGSKPAAADTVILRDSDVNIVTGLDQNTITLAKLVIEASYTGLIGLRYNEIAMTADGETTSTAFDEYREDYLRIGWDRLEVGANTGTGTPGGSPRLKLDNTKSGASTTEIVDTASSGQDQFKPPLRLKLAHASADIHMRGGNVGVGVDVPAETSTIGNVEISPQASGSRLQLGDGVTVSGDVTMGNGAATLRAAANMTGTVAVSGGTATIEGDFTIATLNVDGGVVIDNHVKTAAAAVTTCNLRGGELNWQYDDEARTYTTLTHTGGTLVDNPNVTITTYNRARARAAV